MKRIAIATTNKGKITGVQRAFDAHGGKYGWGSYELLPASVESGVAATPTDDESGLEGCANRLSSIRAIHPTADLYIAMEGVIASVKKEKYVRGWTMMYEPLSGNTVTAAGSSVQVPKPIALKINKDEEFSNLVVRELGQSLDKKETVRSTGANGVFTDGEYTREDSFYDGIRICLALLANEVNWPNSQGTATFE